MKRFITYLYVYENGEKGKNAGFIKAETREGNVRLEVHLRNIGRYQGNADAYLMAVDSTKSQGIGIKIGEIEFRYGGANAYFEQQEQQIGDSTYSFADIVGVRIPLDETHFIASCWIENAEDAVIGKWECWSVQPGQQKKSKDLQYEKVQKVKSKLELQLERKIESENAIQPDTEKKLDNVIRPNAGATPDNVNQFNVGTRIPPNIEEQIDMYNQPYAEIPTDEDVQNEIDRNEEDDEQSEYVQGKRNEYPSADYRRIDIADIHKLPKKNWYLCNNSFLIHGFFNYHYLVHKTIQENGQTKHYLGVPGVYEKPERMMALLFGFPEFEKIGSNSDLSMNPDSNLGQQPNSGSNPNLNPNPNMSENFGYWLCLLDM